MWNARDISTRKNKRTGQGRLKTGEFHFAYMYDKTEKKRKNCVKITTIFKTLQKFNNWAQKVKTLEEVTLRGPPCTCKICDRCVDYNLLKS